MQDQWNGFYGVKVREKQSFFFGSKDWQPCKSGNGKPLAQGLDSPKPREIFSTLDKGCPNLSFRLFFFGVDEE